MFNAPWKAIGRFRISNIRLHGALASLTILLALALTSLGTTGVALSQNESDLDLSVLNDETNASITNSEQLENNAETDAVEKETINAAAPATSIGSERTRFLDLVAAGGWIGVILLLASVVAVTMIIRFCFLLRKSTFIPRELFESTSNAIRQGNAELALQLATSSDSLFGRALSAGLREANFGWFAVEKALEDSISSLAAKLYRKTEPLSIIGNVAPMLGLLGTVMGMVSTFGELAVSDGSGRNLANGIYFALVTTVDGLLVAIPVLVAHSFVNARVASLVSETTDAIIASTEPLKQSIGNATSNSCRSLEQPLAVASRGVSNVSRAATGLQEISTPTETTVESTKEYDHSRQSRRPVLSLKNRRHGNE